MSQRIAAIGIALVAVILALFAFTRQQGAANNEATAVANAQSAAVAQSQAEAAQQTAAFQMDAHATAQTEAEATRSAALLSAQQSAATAFVAVSQATQQELRAATAFAEATEQAETAAQAQSQAAEQAVTATAAANEVVQLAATADARQTQSVATADALQAQLTAQSDLLQSQQSLATSSVATAASVATSGAATAAAQSTGSALSLATAIADRSTSEAELVATAHAAQTQAAQIAVTATSAQESIQATQSALATQAAIPPAPQEDIQFLVQRGVIPENTGNLASRLGTTTVDMSGKIKRSVWIYIPGSFADFVVSADVSWGAGDSADYCDFVLRLLDDNNHYVIGINRLGHTFFDALQKGEWEGTEPYVSSSAIRTGAGDTNHFVVAAVGSLFTVYVNDQLVAAFHHTGFTNGQVGVGAETDFGLKGAGCTFQNSWVWDLSPQEATLTPTPALPILVVPLASGTPFPIPTLNQRITTQDGKLTVNYPVGWQPTESNGTVSLYSSGFSSFSAAAVPSGEMAVVISPTQGASLLDLDTVLKFLTDSVTNSFASQVSITFSEPDTLPLTGHQVRRSIGTSPYFDVEVWVYADQESIITVIAFCASGEVRLCEPTLSAVVKTIKYNPAG